MFWGVVWRVEVGKWWGEERVRRRWREEERRWSGTKLRFKAAVRNDTVFSLLVTVSHIIIRFAEYACFPTRLWTLTQQYNPVGFIAACQSFLELPEEELDFGNPRGSAKPLFLGSLLADRLGLFSLMFFLQFVNIFVLLFDLFNNSNMHVLPTRTRLFVAFATIRFG